MKIDEPTAKDLLSAFDLESVSGSSAILDEIAYVFLVGVTGTVPANFSPNSFAVGGLSLSYRWQDEAPRPARCAVSCPPLWLAVDGVEVNMELQGLGAETLVAVWQAIAMHGDSLVLRPSSQREAGIAALSSTYGVSAPFIKNLIANEPILRRLIK